MNCCQSDNNKAAVWVKLPPLNLHLDYAREYLLERDVSEHCIIYSSFSCVGKVLPMMFLMMLESVVRDMSEHH